MQDGQKAVGSIPYISVAFFPSLKQNFIAYRSSKVSWRPDCSFEMVLFCAAIRRDSVSLLRFPFLSHVQVFSCEIRLFVAWNVQTVVFLLIFDF